MAAASLRFPSRREGARTALGAAALALASLLAAAAPVAAQLVGSISGTVTAGGSPVANVWVSATPVTPTGDWAGRGFVTSTDALGRYSFPDVYVPHVKVQARAPALSGLASTYWPRAFSFEAADVLGVASSGSTADIELASGGSVSGTVVAGCRGAWSGMLRSPPTSRTHRASSPWGPRVWRRRGSSGSRAFRRRPSCCSPGPRAGTCWVSGTTAWALPALRRPSTAGRSPAASGSPSPKGARPVARPSTRGTPWVT